MQNRYMEGQFTERCSVVAFHVHEAGRTFTRSAHAIPAKMDATAAVLGHPRRYALVVTASSVTAWSEPRAMGHMSCWRPVSVPGWTAQWSVMVGSGLTLSCSSASPVKVAIRAVGK
jgi:hypothetical protein